MSSISGGPTNISPNLSVNSVGATESPGKLQTQTTVRNNAMEAGLLNQGMQLGDMSEMMAMLMAKMNEMQGPSSKAQIQDQIASRKNQLNEMQAKLGAASGNAQQIKDQGNLALANSMVQATMGITQGLMGKLNPLGLFSGGMKMQPPPPPPPPNTLVGIMAKAQQQLGMPKGLPNPLDTLMKFQQPPQSPQNLINSLLKGPLSPPASSQKLNPPAPPAKTDAQTLQDMQNTMNELIKKTQSQAATTTALMDKMMGSMNNMMSTMQNMQNKTGF